MSKLELQEECKYWRLPYSGNKDILKGRLEDNIKANKGQMILPFTIKVPPVLPSTPGKRRRNQSVSEDDETEEDDVAPSQKEIKLSVKEEASIEKESKKTCNQVLGVTTEAPASSAGHALQEDNDPIREEDVPGREIVGLTSFPQGEFHQNQSLTGENIKISKNQNYGDSPSKPRSPHHFHHPFEVHKNHQNSPFKSPQPGIHREPKSRAPHNGPGTQCTKLE